MPKQRHAPEQPPQASAVTTPFGGGRTSPATAGRPPSTVILISAFSSFFQAVGAARTGFGPFRGSTTTVTDGAIVSRSMVNVLLAPSDGQPAVNVLIPSGAAMGSVPVYRPEAPANAVAPVTGIEVRVTTPASGFDTLRSASTLDWFVALPASGLTHSTT